MSYQPVIPEGVLPLVHSGKVRETYATLDPNFLLQVATDRVSTHNVVHQSCVPDKGEILTMLTIFWFTGLLKDLPNHLHAWGTGIYQYLPESVREQVPNLHHRALVVRKLTMLPVEFIFRRYLTGSLLKMYLRGEDLYGLALPGGLVQMSRFDYLAFTPTDKSETDEPLNADCVETAYEKPMYLAHYATLQVEKHLALKGIALVDTKLELGIRNDESPEEGECVLADEVFTPDSSRFVSAHDVSEGVEPPWLDKQHVRAEAERLWGDSPKTPLTFSDLVLEQTAGKYRDLLGLISGRSLEEWRILLDDVVQ